MHIYHTHQLYAYIPHTSTTHIYHTHTYIRYINYINLSDMKCSIGHYYILIILHLQLSIIHKLLNYLLLPRICFFLLQFNQIVLKANKHSFTCSIRLELFQCRLSFFDFSCNFLQFSHDLGCVR